MSANKETEIEESEDTLSESKSGSSSVPPFKFRREPIRGGQKIGRNILCPCGSGNKYKYCCLKKKEQNIINQLRMAELNKEAREYVHGYDKKEGIEKPKEEKKFTSHGVAKSQSTA